MGGDKPKSDRKEPRQDYEATMNDFLDKEITASAPAGQNAGTEDLDALVSNLLKEVISEADGQAPSVETSIKGPSSPPAASASAQRRPTAAPVQRDKTRKADVRVPSFAVAQSRPAAGKRGLLIAAALVCLLASIGFGIYHMTGKKSERPPAPVSVSTSAPEAAKPEAQPAAQPATPAPVAAAPATVPAKAAPAAAPPKPALSAQAPASHEAAKESKSPATAPATTRETKTEVPAAVNKPAAEPAREISTPAVAANAPAPPAASPEKPAQPAVTVVETPVPPQPEKTGSAPAAPPKEEPKTETPPPTNRAESPAPASPAPSKPSVPSVVSPAIATFKPAPDFPEAARRMRIKGTVVLEVNIDASGTVTHASVVSGDSVLANSAVLAVMRWKYKPALVNGKAVASTAHVSFVFNN